MPRMTKLHQVLGAMPAANKQAERAGACVRRRIERVRAAAQAAAEQEAALPPGMVGLLTAEQVAAFCQVSVQTVHRLTNSGVLPAYILGRKLFRYDIEAVRAALPKLIRAQAQEPNS